MATALSASLKPTRARILIVVLVVGVLLGYGVATAHRASSVTLTKKAFAGVQVLSGTATLVHPSHITGVTRFGNGQYDVTFDRHVDNCSFSVTADWHGGVITYGDFLVLAGPNTSVKTVDELDPSGSFNTDGDFDIIALCPGT